MQCASSITSRPTDAANSGSMSSRKRGLFSRSGLISSRSIVPAGEPVADVVPLLAVGAVDRVRAQPEALGGRDLVAHQRQQRADDQRRSGARLPEQRGGDEVHRRLPQPVRWTHRTRARSATTSLIASSCPRAEPRIRIVGENT